MTFQLMKVAFNKVGWFIPPYLQVGFLQRIQNLIETEQDFNQSKLEIALSLAYTPQHLATMICERYSITPYVTDYKEIVAEAIEAHCARLSHAAVLGLTPVIEGVGRRLLESRGLAATSIRGVFETLADDCQAQALNEQIGATDEVVAMLEAFKEFATNFLYVKSELYSLEDRTNRHGVLHGLFSDGDYGQPINFFKIVGCLDFLCFIAAFRARISWSAPDTTPASLKLSTYYYAVLAQSQLRPPTSTAAS